MVALHSINLATEPSFLDQERRIQLGKFHSFSQLEVATKGHPALTEPVRVCQILKAGSIQRLKARDG